MALYTALRYRNDLSVFDHHDDGILEEEIESHSVTPIIANSKDKEFDLSEVRGFLGNIFFLLVVNNSNELCVDL